MLCSVCHKNVAVIFAKKIEGDKSQTEGLCYECAKKKGINPLEFLVQQSGLTDEQLQDMSNQFDSILGDITGDMSPEEIENLENQSANLGSIFSNMFGGVAPEAEGQKNEKSNTKVKTKPKEKKKSFVSL